MRILIKQDEDIIAYAVNVVSCSYAGPENGGYQVGFNCLGESKVILVNVYEDKSLGDKLVYEIYKNGFIDLTNNENVYIEDYDI